MSRTLIVGGGLSGLVCARALQSRGADVTVLESRQTPGGVVETEERGGYLLEWGPNTVAPTPDLMRLIEDLGISGEVVRADPLTPRYLEDRGALHPAPMSPGGFLASRLLSTRGKLRLLAEPLVRRGGSEGESVRDFLARRMGAEVARLADAFVSGVFAGDARQLAAAAAFPRLVELERRHGGILRGLLASRSAGAHRAAPRGLLSFRRGMATLPRALGAALGERLKAGTTVTEVRRERGSWVVRHNAGEAASERLVLALPARDAASMLRQLAPTAADALEAIPHPPLAVLHVAYPHASLARAPAGFGHLVVPQPGRRILGAVWSSSLFPGRAPDGEVLLCVFLGGARDPAAASLSDAELLRIAASDLRGPLRARNGPSLVAVRRYPRSIPQYDAGHIARIAAVEAAQRALPGLLLIGNYRGGVSVGDVIASAQRAAAV